MTNYNCDFCHQQGPLYKDFDGQSIRMIPFRLVLSDMSYNFCKECFRKLMIKIPEIMEQS